MNRKNIIKINEEEKKYFEKEKIKREVRKYLWKKLICESDNNMIKRKDVVKN